MSNIGVNKVILIGNAGRDAEVKSTSGGKNVANFSFFKQKTAYEIIAGDWSSDVCSSDLAWNKLAEIAGKYVRKGRLVFVEGRLRTRQYEDREGTDKTVSEVVVTTLRVLGGVKNNSPGHADPDAPIEAAPEAGVGDIPF